MSNYKPGTVNKSKCAAIRNRERKRLELSNSRPTGSQVNQTTRKVNEIDGNVGGLKARIEDAEKALEDSNARLDALCGVGTVHLFDAESNPALDYGGVWQVLDTHLYSGLWLYVRKE